MEWPGLLMQQGSPIMVTDEGMAFTLRRSKWNRALSRDHCGREFNVSLDVSA
jgi:hypothetical protein